MNQVHDPADFVIGVDTHKHTHTASVVDACGMKLDAFELPADATGYLRMHTLAQRRAPGTRIWAIEGAGGHGRGLATHLIEQRERVFEIDRPSCPARRDRAKNDELDATRAAREYLARREPTELRSRGAREAIRAILRTRDCAVRARTLDAHNPANTLGPGRMRHHAAFGPDQPVGAPYGPQLFPAALDFFKLNPHAT